MCFLSERIGGKVVNRWTQGCIGRRCSSTACRRREPEETHDTSWINTIIVPSFHCNDQLSIITPFCASHWEFVRLLFQIWTGSCNRDQDDAWRRPSGLKFIGDHCMRTWWWYNMSSPLSSSASPMPMRLPGGDWEPRWTGRWPPSVPRFWIISRLVSRL